MKASVVCAAFAILSLSCSDVADTTRPLGSGSSGGGAGSTGGTGPTGAAGPATSGGAAGFASGGSGLPQAGSAGIASTTGSAAGGTGGGVGSAGSAGAGPLDGAGLYEQSCQVCHDAQGIGGKLGPQLQHPVRDWSAWVVRHGLPGVGFAKPMEKVGPEKLSDADLTKIWDYLDQPPQPTTGQALYVDYCANCHGADGRGGPTTRNILMELPKLRDMVKKGAHPGEFDMRKEYMPSLNPARLTDAEVELIYAYVDSL
jgi:mono/diheme cytochrome c family protein